MTQIGSVHAVRVVKGRKGDPIMEIENAIAFPDRRWNPGPVIGSEWRVEVVAKHPTKNVWYVRGFEEINTRAYNSSWWESTPQHTFETKVVALETGRRQNIGAGNEVEYFKIPILDGATLKTLQGECGVSTMGMGWGYRMAVVVYKVTYKFFNESFFVTQSCEFCFPDLVGASEVEITVNVHPHTDVAKPVEFTIVKAIAV